MNKNTKAARARGLCNSAVKFTNNHNGVPTEGYRNAPPIFKGAACTTASQLTGKNNWQPPQSPRPHMVQMRHDRTMVKIRMGNK